MLFLLLGWTRDLTNASLTAGQPLSAPALKHAEQVAKRFALRLDRHVDNALAVANVVLIQHALRGDAHVVDRATPSNPVARLRLCAVSPKNDAHLPAHPRNPAGLGGTS